MYSWTPIGLQHPHRIAAGSFAVVVLLDSALTRQGKTAPMVDDAETLHGLQTRWLPRLAGQPHAGAISSAGHKPIEVYDCDLY